MTERKTQTCLTFRRSIALAAGISFLILAATNLLRWEALEGWYRWSTVSGLLGGLFLLATTSGVIRFPHSRLLIHPLLTFGVLLPLDALAFFIVMRIPMDWMDWLEFAHAPALLMAWWMTLFFTRKSRS